MNKSENNKIFLLYLNISLIVYSALYKNFIQIIFGKGFEKKIGFNITGIFIASLLLLILKIFYKYKKKYINLIKENYFVLIFFLILFSSALFTSSKTYYLIKLAKYFLCFILFICGSLANKKDLFVLPRITFIMSIISMITIIYYMLGLNLKWPNVPSGVNMNVSYYAYAMLIICLYDQSLKVSSLHIFSIVFCVFFSFSRGAFVSFLIITILAKLFSIKADKRLIFLILFSLVGIFTFIVFIPPFKDFIMHTLQKKLYFQINGKSIMTKSIDIRVDYIMYVINEFLSQPIDFIFGRGLGSFPIYYHQKEIHSYPHNMLLELIFENGLISAIFIYYFIKKNVLYQKKDTLTIIFIFYCIINLFSFSFSDNKALFFFAGLLYNRNKYMADSGMKRNAVVE